MQHLFLLDYPDCSDGDTVAIQEVQVVLLQGSGGGSGGSEAVKDGHGGAGAGAECGSGKRGVLAYLMDEGAGPGQTSQVLGHLGINWTIGWE